VSETFEEWFKSEGHGDFFSFSKDYYAGQWAPLIKLAWNHQQKKIDELEKEQVVHIKALKEELGKVHKKEIKTLQAEADRLNSQLEKAKEAIYNECDKTTDERGRKYLESVIKQLETGE